MSYVQLQIDRKIQRENRITFILLGHRVACGKAPVDGEVLLAGSMYKEQTQSLLSAFPPALRT